MRCWGWLRRIQPFGPVTFMLFLPIENDRLRVLTAIRRPIVRMPAAPLAVGLNIVVPIIRIGGSSGLLPTAFAFPLALGGSAELLLGRLRAGVKELATGRTTPLFHTKPLFD
jgi:hypothetical protein